MNEPAYTSALQALIGQIDIYLASLDCDHIGEVRAGIAAAAGTRVRDVSALTSPTLAHLAPALQQVRANGREGLADAIADISPHLHWIRYDLYDRADIGERFADNHAFATLIGESGPIEACGFELGLFIIAPDTFYRDHRHAAAELYAPLTGPHGFRFAPGAPLDWLPADRPVWNDPFRHHAIKTGPEPFLCVYAWTTDIDEPATIIHEPDWDALENARPPH